MVALRKESTDEHAHRWRIASPNGDSALRGDCDCGAVKLFPATPDEDNEFQAMREGGWIPYPEPSSLRIPLAGVPGCYTYAHDPTDGDT